MQTLVCRKLQIVDPQNKVVGEMGLDADGEAYTNLYNGSYRKTVAPGATTDTGAGSIWVYDENGKMTSSLYSKTARAWSGRKSKSNSTQKGQALREAPAFLFVRRARVLMRQ